MTKWTEDDPLLTYRLAKEAREQGDLLRAALWNLIETIEATGGAACHAPGDSAEILAAAGAGRLGRPTGIQVAGQETPGPVATANMTITHLQVQHDRFTTRRNDRDEGLRRQALRAQEHRRRLLV